MENGKSLKHFYYTNIFFLMFIVSHYGDDYIMNEQSKSQHACQSRETTVKVGNVQRVKRVCEINVNAPTGAFD